MTTRRWQLAHGRHLDLGPKSVVVGILNVTPDSFSDGGLFIAPEKAIAQARRMAEEGAAIIDIGGESGEALISVDTYREDTARRAVAAGAHIVNDVWGLQREPGIARVAAETGAGLIIMHTGRERQKLPDVIEDQLLFLSKSLEIARASNVAEDQI
ncbi:MAG: dihydropteroate synthase, partial [Mesorhizobium sp.]